jgi:hypothetical protein
MMYILLYLIILLSLILQLCAAATIHTLSPAAAPASPSPPVLAPRSTKCPHTHYPTLSQYRAAYTVYCDKRFTPSLSLAPHAKLVYTYILTDGSGQPIQWVLSVEWDPADFSASGQMLIERDRCYRWFEKEVGAGGKWVCSAPDGGELVKGGRRNAFENVEGIKVWVETRKRGDDVFKPQGWFE